MSIQFPCPSCGKVLRAQDDAVGLKVRCPECNATTKVPDSSGEDEPAPFAPAEKRPARSDSSAGDDEGRRPCSMCGEMIAASAVKCRFCGEIFDETLRRAEKKKMKKASGGASDDDLTVAEIIVAILCSGIGCICSIIWMIQGKPKGTKMMGLSLIGMGLGVALRFILAAMTKR